MIKQLWTIGLSTIFLTACETNRQKLQFADRFQVARDVCNLQLDVPNSIAAYQTISGSIVNGPVTQQIVREWSTIWSAIYATKSPNTTRLTSDICWTTTWVYPGVLTPVPVNCQTMANEDISALYGVGRAETQEDAERIAEDNCENIVDQYLEDTGIRYESEFSCTRLAVEQCFSN